MIEVIDLDKKKLFLIISNLNKFMPSPSTPIHTYNEPLITTRRRGEVCNCFLQQHHNVLVR